MSHSLFPADNYLVWISLKNRVQPNSPGSAMSRPYLDNLWRNLGDLSWPETPPVERAQTGEWFVVPLAIAHVSADCVCVLCPCFACATVVERSKL